ncbi:MAG: tetratricopeptide (TPR) repeat protein [Desulforhopalus sp.]|jgi:tetratricopeptide (TPR) repeat protein
MKKASLFLLVLNLLLVSFLSGTSQQLSTLMFGGVIGIALLISVLGASFKRYDFVRVVGVTPLCFFLCIPLFQLIPLPPLLIEAISPATYQLYEPLLSLEESERWIPLSVMPKTTLQEFFRIVSYGFTYILTVQLLTDTKILKKVAKITVLWGGTLAFWVIIRAIVSEVPSAAEYVGLFVMVCPLACALFFYYKPLVQKDEGLHGNLKLLIVEPGFHRHIFFGCSAILMIVAVGTPIYQSVDWVGRAPFSYGIFDEAYHFLAGRFYLWQNCVALIKNFSIFGSGLGSFETIYSYFSQSAGGLDIRHTQNDCIELLVETGGAGTLLAVWFFLTIVWHTLKKITTRRDRFVVLLGIGSLSGIVLFLVHSLIFSNFYVGFTGVYFFFFLGVLIAVVNSRFAYNEVGTFLCPVLPGRLLILGITVIVVLSASLMFHGGFWYAQSLHKAVKFGPNNTNRSSIQHDVEMKTMLEAAKFDPLESVYSYRLGQLEFDVAHNSEGMEHLLDAGFKNVMEGQVFQALGLMTKGDIDIQTDLIEIGYERAPYSEALAQNLCQWFFDNGRRADALELAGKRLGSNYRTVEIWMPLLNDNNVKRDELSEFLPFSVDAWLYLAEYSEVNDNREDSDFYYEGALILISENVEIDPEWFIKIITYYKKNNRTDMAILSIRRAVTLASTVGVFHRLLGDYYLDEKVIYRAKEEYERALELDPDDSKARSLLLQISLWDNK